MQKFVKHVVVSTLILLSLLTGRAYAQDAGIAGTVIDAASGRPLAGAMIEILGDGNTALANASSDASGHYQATALPEALVTVRVRMNGYRLVEENGFRLVAGKTVPLNISLQIVREEIDEIIVTARASALPDSGSVAATRLTREEIRRAPGTAGDVFRGLNTLPGVASTGEFSDFTVRGRGPRDNLILIDGIPYDRLVHFDESLGEEDDLEGGGRFSIFGQNVVGGAVFQPGGWDASEGGANGSLLRLDVSEGNPEDAFTSVKLDLAGGEFLYDGPAGSLADTSVLVSMRHYNFGWLFETIGEEDIGAPKLSDVILKSVTDLSARSTLKVLALYTPEVYTRSAKNVLASEDYEDATIVRSKQQAGLFGITLENLIGENGRLRNIIYYRQADDDNRQGEAFPERSPGPLTTDNLVIEDPILTLNEAETEAGWRMDYSQLNGWGEFNAGSRINYLGMDFNRTVSRDYPVFIYDRNDFRPDPSVPYVVLTPALYNNTLDESAMRAALYADQKFDMGAFSLRPGLRVEHDGLLDDTRVSPRLQTDWQIASDTRLSLTGGIYYQPPRLLEIAANPANLDRTPERSRQINFGVEHYFNNDYRLLVETYYQKLDRLIIESDQVTGLLSNSGEGWSAGLDALLSRRFTDRWSATLRYSYSKAVVDNQDGRGEIPADFSRPHLANLTLSYEPNERWAFSGQYQYTSGQPSDEYVIYADVFNDPTNLRYSREITLRNVGRFPSFQTLNVRVDYRYSLRAINLIAFVDIINVLGRKNVSEQEFSPRTGEIEIDGLETFPQLGLTLEF